MAIEVYAVESAILRAEKLAAKESFHAATAADIAQVYVADAADRLEHSAKNVVAALEPADGAGLTLQLQYLLRHGPVNTVSARRRVANVVIAANRYPL